MRIDVSFNVVQFRRQLRDISAKSFAFGVKNASDRAGRFLVKSFQREWNRKMNVRRRSFPRNVLRVERALVDPNVGVVTRPTRVYNKFANEVLKAQLRGAVRRPSKSQYFFIPIRTGGRRRRAPKTFRAGKYIFAYNTRGDRLIGTLAEQVKVEPRLDYQRVLRSVRKTYIRLLRASLARELRRRQAGPAPRPIHPPVSRGPVNVAFGAGGLSLTRG